LNKLLPVHELLKETFLKPWFIRKSILHALIIPVLLGAILGVISEFIDEEGIYYYFYVVLASVIYILIAINCHRLILLGENSVPLYGINRWTVRETYFLFCFFLFYFFIPFIYSLFSLYLYEVMPINIDEYFWSSTILIWTFLILFLWVTVRTILIFPRIAIDHRANFNIIKWSWMMTKNNTCRLFVLVLLTPSIIYLPIHLIEELIKVNFTHGSVIQIIFLFIEMLLSYTLEIFIIAALSVSYKWLSENNN